MIALDTENNYSLLGYACLYDNYPAVQKLIALKADIDRAYEDMIYQYDALYLAIKQQDTNLVKLLLANGADANREYTEDAMTPLYCASMFGNFPIARMLVQAGAKVDGTGNMGGDYILYPLFAAIQTSNPDLIRLLVENGADTSIVDKQSSTVTTALSNITDPTTQQELLKALFPALESWYGSYQATVQLSPKADFDGDGQITYVVEIRPNNYTYSKREYRTDDIYQCEPIAVSQEQISFRIIPDNAPPEYEEEQEASIPDTGQYPLVTLARKDGTVAITGPFVVDTDQRFGASLKAEKSI